MCRALAISVHVKAIGAREKIAHKGVLANVQVDFRLHVASFVPRYFGLLRGTYTEQPKKIDELARQDAASLFDPVEAVIASALRGLSVYQRGVGTRGGVGIIVNLPRTE